MLTLPELQARFAAGLLAVEDPALVDLIDGDGLDPRARLSIYRHHVFTTLTSVLEEIYPVVCRLVDRRFFAYAADAFIRRHPPAGPCLGEYGGDFPDFLGEFPPCAHLPYLPDVARLEWVIHGAAIAPPAAALDRERLREVDAAMMAELRSTSDPSLAYITTPWPVDAIWTAHQDGGSVDALTDMSPASLCLEVRRVENEVTIHRLEAATYLFRDALSRGLTLGDAAAAAIDSDPAFDLEPEIRSMLEDNLFKHFSVTTAEGAST